MAEIKTCEQYVLRELANAQSSNKTLSDNLELAIKEKNAILKKLALVTSFLKELKLSATSRDTGNYIRAVNWYWQDSDDDGKEKFNEITELLHELRVLNKDEE